MYVELFDDFVGSVYVLVDVGVVFGLVVGVGG